MKTILFLGGAHFQLPAIVYATQKGYATIVLDASPLAPGHRLASRSYRIDTTDRGAVHRIVKREAIDGILSFGSDPAMSVVSAVAKALGLPHASPSSIDLLTNKAQFRSFLNSTGIQQSVWQEVGERDLPVHLPDTPSVVKPVDSSGSKGVSFVSSPDGLQEAIRYAKTFSKTRTALIEPFVGKKGYQVCGDGYMEDGRVVFLGFGDGYYNDDHVCFAPYAEAFPSSHPPATLNKIQETVEAILQEAGYLRGPFNIDVLVRENDTPFIVEIGPRSGGNFIPSALKYATGIDLVEAAVESALSAEYRLALPALPKKPRFIASYMIHSSCDGVLESIKLDASLDACMLEYNPYRSPGDFVHAFRSGKDALGNILLSFATDADMRTSLAAMREKIVVTVNQ